MSKLGEGKRDAWTYRDKAECRLGQPFGLLVALQFPLPIMPNKSISSIRNFIVVHPKPWYVDVIRSFSPSDVKIGKWNGYDIAEGERWKCFAYPNLLLWKLFMSCEARGKVQHVHFQQLLVISGRYGETNLGQTSCSVWYLRLNAGIHISLRICLKVGDNKSCECHVIRTLLCAYELNCFRIRGLILDQRLDAEGLRHWVGLSARLFFRANLQENFKILFPLPCVAHNVVITERGGPV